MAMNMKGYICRDEKMDKAFGRISCLYVGLYDYFKEHICVKAPTGKDGKAFEKIH